MANKNNKNFYKILDWINQRLVLFCFQAPELGLYCDQTWLSHMVQLFSDDCFVMRNFGYNVAYWNIKNRKIIKKGKEYRVKGNKLVCFHFSGFSCDLKEDLSKHSKFKINQDKVLQEIVYEYKNKLLINDFNLKNIKTFPISKKPLKKRIKERSNNLGYQLFKDSFEIKLLSRITKKFNFLIENIKKK